MNDAWEARTRFSTLNLYHKHIVTNPRVQLHQWLQLFQLFQWLLCYRLDPGNLDHQGIH